MLFKGTLLLKHIKNWIIVETIETTISYNLHYNNNKFICPCFSIFFSPTWISNLVSKVEGTPKGSRREITPNMLIYQLVLVFSIRTISIGPASYVGTKYSELCLGTISRILVRPRALFTGIYATLAKQPSTFYAVSWSPMRFWISPIPFCSSPMRFTSVIITATFLPRSDRAAEESRNMYGVMPISAIQQLHSSASRHTSL